LRILELITLGEIGGAQTVLVDLVRGFAEDSSDVEVDVVSGPGDYIPHALNGWFRGDFIRLPFLRREISPFDDIRTLFYLKKLCRERRYDIVHCHSSKASVLGRLAANMTGVPRVVVTIHGLSFALDTPSLAAKVYRTVEKLLFPLNSEYIFVSPADMHEMEDMGLKEEKCRLIPNGRPLPDKLDKGLRNILPIGEDEPIVCMIGRLSWQKNPQSFIRIAKQVSEAVPKGEPVPQFVLIGDGPLHDECLDDIKRSGRSNIHILGPMADAGRYFWEADVALLTSNYEACPLVVIEAMSTGIPVVATDVGGTSSVLKSGEIGYLFDQDKEEDAAKYILHLLDNEQLRAEIGRKALERYRKEFTVERMVENYVNYFGLKK